jgi:hypothetical protein
VVGLFGLAGLAGLARKRNEPRVDRDPADKVPDSSSRYENSKPIWGAQLS